MAVRALSGTSWIRFPAINLGGAYTLVALVKMMDTTVPSGWQALSTSADSSTHSQITHYVRGTAGSISAIQGVQSLDVTVNATARNGAAKAITNPASWKILAITKAAGIATPRIHTFPLGGAWTHENADGPTSNGNTQAGGKFYLGAYADPSTAALGDFCNVRLALYGVWNGTELTDLQVEALATGSATSAWTGHAVTPTEVWELTQASTATSIVGLVGASTQDAITGTTVVTGDDPSGWTFSGGGGSSASGSFTTHGGGDSVAVGRKGALRAVTTSGGGDSTAVGTQAQVRSGSLATHGGGDSTAVGRKDAVASHDEASALPPFTVQVTGTVTTGGGDSTTAGTASAVDNRNGSFATHGGGDSTAAGVKGALRATASTAGGDSAATGAKAVQRTLSTTGGGDSTASGTAGQASTGSLTTHGGGDSTATGVKIAARAAPTTGGGDSTAVGVKAVQRSFTTTGGGDSTGSGTSVAGPSGRVQCTGGGATTFTGKRATVASLGCTAGGHLTSSGRKATTRAVGCTGNGDTRLVGINGVLVPITYPTGHSGRILSGMTGRASHHI